MPTIKQLLNFLFDPTSICILLTLIGILSILWRPRHILGKGLIIISTILLILFSTPWLPNTLLQNLEDQHSPYSKENYANKNVTYIVILGGGTITHTTEKDVQHHLNSSSLQRLIEGICIYKNNPGTKIIVSGNDPFSDIHDADQMASLAKNLRIPTEDIIIENQSKNTEEQAQNIQKIVTDKPFILVTSAYHMPRSMVLFKRVGTHPIPAPTNYLTTSPKMFWQYIQPTSSSLNKTKIATHEYIGQLWAKIRKKA